MCVCIYIYVYVCVCVCVCVRGTWDVMIIIVGNGYREPS